MIAFLFGACIGSFLNVCVSRWPHDQSVVKPRSRCPKCGHEIPWYENIPLVSWVALRARCSGCKNPISPIYPLLELVVALGWLGAELHYGATLTAFRVAVLGTILLGIMITDATHYVIPDGFTVFGLIWIILTAFAAIFLNSDSAFAGPYDAMMGALTGAGAIAIAGWLGEAALKREAMGFGDVTLMAVVGAALGPQRALLTVFMGAALGVVVFLGIVLPANRMRARARRPDGTGVATLPLVPFGVFLAPGAIIVLFYGDTLIHWYFTRFIAS